MFRVTHFKANHLEYLSNYCRIWLWIEMCSVNFHCSVPHFLKKIRQRDLAKLLGAFFILHCESVKYIYWWRYASCRLVMARLIQILTIRLLSTEHGMGRVDFHGTAHVDWTRNGPRRFSRYGSCRLTKKGSFRFSRYGTFRLATD